MSEETELKLCPFCGSPAWLRQWGSGWALTCRNNRTLARLADFTERECPIAIVLTPTKAEAITAWNTRPGEQAAAAQAVEAERGRIKVAVYDMIEEYADNTNISGHLLGFVAGFADRIMTTINAENK